MPAPIRLINDGTLPDTDPIDASSVLGGRPEARLLNVYTNESGTFTAGIWECSPGTLRVDCYPVDEYCWLISGEVVLIDEDGNEERFVAGEGFVVPKGFVGTWHMPTSVRKHYVILEEQAN